MRDECRTMLFEGKTMINTEHVWLRENGWYDYWRHFGNFQVHVI